MYTCAIYRVYPTCVGMIRFSGFSDGHTHCLSHMRGNDSLRYMIYGDLTQFIPHAWE